VIGFVAVGTPMGLGMQGWLLAGAVTAVGFVVASTTALRFDLTMVPLALGTMAVVGTLGRAAQRAFPGALAGSVVGALVAALIAWWLFRLLRAWRASQYLA